MSGHSKWSTIKRKKGANDAKRGALFSKLIREITIAAKDGGPDIESNPALRSAVIKARSNNMPSDNIDRAIKKAIGSADGVNYEEVRYEGYGPGGVAIMVDCLTDNKNRTTPEVRTAFTKNGGSLGETGSVNYLFERKGLIIIESGQTSEDDILELLIDYGVEDIKTEEENIVITTSQETFNEISEVISEKNYKLLMNEITYVSQTSIPLDEKKGSQCLKIIEVLEDLDDTQNVYSNYDIPDEIMMKISQEQ